MLKKIHKYLLKITKISLVPFKGIRNYYCRIFKTNKKITEYRNRNKKINVINKNSRERNKFNLQLKINFKWSKFKKLIFIIFIIILITIVFLIKWPFFKVENINIIKLDENVNIRLIERKLSYLKWKLLFRVKKEEIEDIIKETEQNIKDISILKIPTSTINIRLSSYEPIFRTNLNWNKYLITENWVFLPTKKENTEKTKITIRGLNLHNYPNYRKILKTENLNEIKYLENKLKDNIVNLKIEDIIYYKIAKEVHFIINNKTRVIFDLEELKWWEIEEKLKQILVFNKEKINITKPWIIYIDNRIKSKIFYCPDTEVDQCIKNINYIYDEKLEKSYYK